MRLLTAAGIISDKIGGDERSWINIRFGKQTVDLYLATMEEGVRADGAQHCCQAGGRLEVDR